MSFAAQSKELAGAVLGHEFSGLITDNIIKAIIYP
jgi:hypothetical protein